jgi:hypothetical protein
VTKIRGLIIALEVQAKAKVGVAAGVEAGVGVMVEALTLETPAAEGK